MSDEDILLVTVLWNERRRDIPSSQAKCTDCARPVAIADSSAPFRRAHPDAVIVCKSCGVVRAMSSDDADDDWKMTRAYNPDDPIAEGRSETIRALLRYGTR